MIYYYQISTALEQWGELCTEPKQYANQRQWQCFRLYRMWNVLNCVRQQ